MCTGVYQIRNKINGKCYVGSTSRGFDERWCEHIKELRNGRHCNRHLQNAWKKYGEAAFAFEVLETCSPGLCIAREQHYLDSLRPEYNICTIAGSTSGYRHSETTKKMLSCWARDRLRDPRKNPMYGASLVGEQNGMYGKTHSAHSRCLMRGVNNGNVKLTEDQVRQIKELRREGISQYRCGEMFGVSRSTIKNIDNGSTWGWVS